MSKMEEYHAPTAATREEQETIKKLFPHTGDVTIEAGILTSWESNFILSLHSNMEEQFVLLLSKKQRFYLVKIWEKLYDAGLVT